jgi:hypothetical protein
MGRADTLNGVSMNFVRLDCMVRHWPALAVLLAGVIWSACAGATDAPAGAGAQPDAALANPLAAHSIAEFTATRERPLFSPTRRPPPPPVVAEVPRPVAPQSPASPPSPPSMALFGTVIGLNGARALIRSGDAGKIVEVGAGDAVGGWTVNQIDKRHLVLSLGERLATFELFSNQGANEHPAVVRQPRRMLEYNAAGVLRSRRINIARP